MQKIGPPPYFDDLAAIDFSLGPFFDKSITPPLVQPADEFLQEFAQSTSFDIETDPDDSLMLITLSYPL